MRLDEIKLCPICNNRPKFRSNCTACKGMGFIKIYNFAPVQLSREILPYLFANR